MNIELRFLQKAIEDRNFISFSYQRKKVENIRPLELRQKESKYYLHTQNEVYKFEYMKNIQISKQKF